MGKEQNYRTFGKPIDRRAGEPLPVTVEDEFVRVKNAVLEPGIIDTNPFETDSDYVILKPGERIAQIFKFNSEEDMTEFRWTFFGFRFKFEKKPTKNISMGGSGQPQIFAKLYGTTGWPRLPDDGNPLGLTAWIDWHEIYRDESLWDLRKSYKWMYKRMQVIPGESPSLSDGRTYAIVIENDTDANMRLTMPKKPFLDGHIARYNISESEWVGSESTDISVRLLWSQKEPLKIEGDVGVDNSDGFPVDVSPDATSDMLVMRGYRITDVYNQFSIDDDVTQLLVENSIVHRVNRNETTAVEVQNIKDTGLWSIVHEPGNLMQFDGMNLCRVTYSTPDRDWLEDDPTFGLKLVDEDDNESIWFLYKKNIRENYMLFYISGKPIVDGNVKMDRIQSITIGGSVSDNFYDEFDSPEPLIYIEELLIAEIGLNVDTEIGDIDITLEDVTTKEYKTEYFDGGSANYMLSSPALEPLMTVREYEDGVWKDITASAELVEDFAEPGGCRMVSISPSPSSGTNNVMIKYHVKTPVTNTPTFKLMTHDVAVMVPDTPSIRLVEPNAHSVGVPVPPGATVLVRALNDNTDVVYIGNETVSSSNGYPLNPAEVVSIPIDDVSRIYLTGDVGDGVKWLVMLDAGAHIKLPGGL